MKTRAVLQKQLESCFRDIYETQSLFRSARSVILRRKVNKVLKLIRNFVKISRNYETDLLMLRENNVSLARAVQNEKERSKNLLQEKIIAESTYHELLKEHVSMKKDLQNLERVILSYDEELKNSMIPNLVKLSDDVTKFKVKNDVMKKLIESKRSGDAAFPKNSIYNGVNFGTNGNQPISAVNPMIKGCVIQKPTINVRRVSLPNETRASLFANVDISSPILEEPEEPLEMIPNRSRKCKNGLRHVINLSNSTVGQPIQSISVSEIDYRNRAEDIDGNINIRMEPVVRLSDVTRMLQNSSYRISESESETALVENSYTTPVRQYSPEVLLKRCKTPTPRNYENQILDNPLEGCSWMFQGTPANQFECSPPVASAPTGTVDGNKSCPNGVTVNASSLPSVNSPAEQRETTKRSETFFREPSLTNDFLIQHNKMNSSRNPGVSNAFLNESSSEMKIDNPRLENTFLSSTLNNSTLSKSSKKKFFSGPPLHEPLDLLTVRRKYSKPSSVVDATCAEDGQNKASSNLAIDNVEINPMLLQNCTSRPRRNSSSHYRKQTDDSSSHHKKQTDDASASCRGDQTEVARSELTIGTVEKETKKSRSKRSTRQSKKKMTERSNGFSVDGENVVLCDSSSDEFYCRKKVKKNEKSKNSSESETCCSRTKIPSSRNRSSGLQKRKSSVVSNISETSERSTNDSDITSSETTSSVDGISGGGRSTRRKANVSYKEPSLARREKNHFEYQLTPPHNIANGLNWYYCEGKFKMKSKVGFSKMPEHVRKTALKKLSQTRVSLNTNKLI